MRLCKYCNKPIAEKDIWNPDNDGNGYHHKCLVHMELNARNKQIYDKGKMDVLDKIRAEIEPKCDRINSLASVLPYTAHREIQELLCEIMDLCKAESEDKE